MFDDPKKELQALEDQLLAAEKNDETAELDTAEFEKLYDEILEEFGPKEESHVAPLPPSDPPIRNFANGYGRAVPKAPAEPVYEYDYRPSHADKSIRGLTMLASIECAAIAAVAIYWFFHFL